MASRGDSRQRPPSVWVPVRPVAGEGLRWRDYFKADALASLPMTVGEIAASVIGRPHETERGDDQLEKLQHRSTVQIRWGVLKGFQNRPTGLNVSKLGARAARPFHRSDYSRPLKFGTVRSVFQEEQQS
jgi:hypothetical protein